MKFKRRKLLSGNNRFRLLLTLGLAVLLPALSLIFVNFHYLESLKRDKQIEALIHADFQQMLAISEKKINQKAYAMTEEVRQQFPSPDTDKATQEKQLASILEKNPWLAHGFLFDREKSYVFQSQPKQMNDIHFRKEHEVLAGSFRGWFSSEGKSLVEGMYKKSRRITCYTTQTKRSTGDVFITTAFFVLPGVISKDRVSVGGILFDPSYLKQKFFPEVLEELLAQKMTDDEVGKRLALMVYPVGEGAHVDQPIAQTAGWKSGQPEVWRKLDDVFYGLALGVKFEGIRVLRCGLVKVFVSLN